MHSKRSGLVTLTVVFLGGLALGNVMQRLDAARAQTNRVYEFRTYVSQPGRLDDVLARFRDHAAPILERHGIRSVGYWVPVEPPASEDTLIYILAHDDADAVEGNWNTFVNDPEWQQAYEESRRNGAIFESVESVYMTATDFSRIQ